MLRFSRRRLPVAVIAVVVAVCLNWIDTPPALADDPLHAGPPFLISTVALHDRTPAVAYNSARQLFLVVWEKEGEIRMRAVNESGVLRGEYVLNNTFARDGVLPDVAYNSAADQFLVVWQQAPDGFPVRQYIRAARVSGDGMVVLSSFWVSQVADSWAPAVAFNPEAGYRDYLVVFGGGGIEAQRVAGAGGSGNTGGGELIDAVIPIATADASYFYGNPDVAYSAAYDRYLVVYVRASQTGDPSLDDIYGRLVTRDGTTPWLQWPIDATGSFAQRAPAVAALTNSLTDPFLVIYEDEFASALSPHITARRVDGDGIPAGYFLDIASTPDNEATPDVVSAPGAGGWLAVWARYYGTDTAWQIWGRWVGQAGNLAPAFMIGAHGPTVGDAGGPCPAVAYGASLALAAWRDTRWGSFTYDITARRLGFLVNLPVTRR